MRCAHHPCTGTGNHRHRGLCHKHYQHDLAARAARGELVRGMVDAWEAQDHVRYLVSCGMSRTAIARAAGMSGNGLRCLMNHRQRIKKYSADKILSVTPESSYRATGDGNEWVQPIGTIRRIQALMAIGYTLRFISESTGHDHDWAGYVIAGKFDHIYASSARAVAELFNRLQLTAAPPSRAASRAKNRAKKEGWPNPLSWDEDMIDDPNGQPVEVKHRRATHVEQYRELQYLGFHDDEIAVRMNVERNWLNKVAARADELERIAS